MPKDWDRKPSCAPRHERAPFEDSALEDFINGNDDFTCKQCDGTGELHSQLCKACGGKGILYEPDPDFF